MFTYTLDATTTGPVALYAAGAPPSEAPKPAAARGRHGEIVLLRGKTLAQVAAETGGALPSHEIGASGRRGQFWSALNVDLYAYDPTQGVAVYQVRQSRSHKYGIEVRKDYFLCGRNEITGQYFRHAVSSASVRSAIRKDPIDPAAGVFAAQRFIFGCTDKQLRASLAAGMRQGDILVIRIPGSPPANAQVVDQATLGGTHVILASEIRTDPDHDDRYFALNPKLIHTKDQHAPVFCDMEGWHSVRLGRSAPAWRPRIGD